MGCGRMETPGEEDIRIQIAGLFGPTVETNTILQSNCIPINFKTS